MNKETIHPVCFNFCSQDGKEIKLELIRTVIREIVPGEPEQLEYALDVVTQTLSLFVSQIKELPHPISEQVYEDIMSVIQKKHPKKLIHFILLRPFIVGPVCYANIVRLADKQLKEMLTKEQYDEINKARK